MRCGFHSLLKSVNCALALALELCDNLGHCSPARFTWLTCLPYPNRAYILQLDIEKLQDLRHAYSDLRPAWVLVADCSL